MRSTGAPLTFNNPLPFEVLTVAVATAFFFLPKVYTSSGVLAAVDILSLIYLFAFFFFS